MLQQQSTSLLSLPNELLIQIFKYLPASLRYSHRPILPLTLVCRRFRNVAHAVMCQHVVLGLYSNATSRFQVVVKENPSLGPLVATLAIYGISSVRDGVEGALLRHYLRRTTIQALSNLKELTLVEAVIDGVAAILAALPPSSLRALNIRISQICASPYWSELWLHLARFPELRAFELDIWPAGSAGVGPRHATTHAMQCVSLPRLVELRIKDHLFIKTLGNAGPLHQIMPSLQELNLVITRHADALAIAAILSQSPSSLTALSLSSRDPWTATSSRFIMSLHSIRHLEFGSGTFVETELLAYLPTAPLESVRLLRDASVTDRVLEALTGPERPPQLQQICLSHLSPMSEENLKSALKNRHSAGRRENFDQLRRRISPLWPTGATEAGLRQALAAANANGIRMTGPAVSGANWDAVFHEVLAEVFMEEVFMVDRYDNILARFGKGVAIAWLEEQGPNIIQLLRTHMRVL
ncbi:hypothetical protein JCM8115_002954 [Rhodotorula mucilaginosa]|jgi:hypothetical protein|uniref:F-box domain-containing protein n=1 Tax=Rhodotorula mucilaginosa TaxID=5537 RepID=A0A9P6VSG7_RHOMI|nr:hypothetical protein C6P46_002503 [Rhodotorula mucilaginosa]